MPTDAQILFAEYQREPRRIRRAVSRDLARAHPVPPRPPSHGVVGELARRRRAMPKRFQGVAVALGDGVPTSGQARINAKRNLRGSGA